MTHASQQARELYEGAEHSWQYDLNWHLERGYLFSSPNYFTMGFPTSSDAVRFAHLEDRSIAFEDADELGDTWFIWIGAGDIAEALRFIPRPMKYVAFARRGVLRMVRFDRLTSLVRNSTFERP